MIKELVSGVGLNTFAQAGLVIFVSVFALVSVWAIFRPRHQIERWSRLALDDTLEAPGGARPGVPGAHRHGKGWGTRREPASRGTDGASFGKEVIQ